MTTTHERASAGMAELVAAWKAYDGAQHASLKAAAARAALPIGSSRARVTTAEARWAQNAERRDTLEGIFLATLKRVADDVG